MRAWKAWAPGRALLFPILPVPEAFFQQKIKKAKITLTLDEIVQISFSIAANIGTLSYVTLCAPLRATILIKVTTSLILPQSAAVKKG